MKFFFRTPVRPVALARGNPCYLAKRDRKSPALTGLTRACGVLGGADVGLGDVQVDIHKRTTFYHEVLVHLSNLSNTKTAPCALYKSEILN